MKTIAERMKVLGALFSSGLTVMFALLWAAPASAQVFGKTFEEVIEKAKQERELRVYWEVPAERGVGAQLEAAFKKRFGFVPRVELTPLTTPDSTTRFLTEVRLGRVDVDLLYAGADDMAPYPERVKLLEDIERPLAEIFGSRFPTVKQILRNVPAWKRPWSVDVTTRANGMVYNTKMTTAAELPKTIEEFAQGKGFTDPKWRGKFAINTLGPATPVGDLAAQGFWDLEKQKRVLRLLLANKPLLKRSSGDIRVAVALGEVPAGLGNVAGTEGLKKEGHPIGLKLFEDVIVVGTMGLTIPKRAKNPNMALLYLAFILEDGLPIIERVNGEGTIFDPRSQLSGLLKAMPQARVLGWTPEELLARTRDKTRKALQELMP